MTTPYTRKQPDPRGALPPRDDRPRYWRSLTEQAAPSDDESLAPKSHSASAELDPPSETGRRTFLQLMGASMAMSSLSGCLRRPTETIVPYVKAPEKLIPGRPLFYASAVTLGGYATGVIVESHEGRPTKIEGNPNHPASLGATDQFAQAEVLGLYDPDRSQAVLYQGQPATRSQFLAVMNKERERLHSVRGQGLYLLTESVTSPLLGEQLLELRTRLPLARWHQYEPIHRDSARAGMQLAFGAAVEPIYHLAAAQVIVSIDADFLSRGPGFIRYARQFTASRRATAGLPPMNRLYMIESVLSVTGSNADHRLALRPRDIGEFIYQLHAAIARPAGAAAPSMTPQSHWVAAVAADLQQHRGASVVIAGDHQPSAVHALVCSINEALGNIGRTVEYIVPAVVEPRDQTESLRTLAQDLAKGQVATLVIIGGNPAYDAPVDLEITRQLHKASLRVHLGLYHDETARLCHWHLPQAHTLESWGDARAFDGTVSLIQPLIAPMYDGRTASELLSLLLGQPDKSAHELLRDYWRKRWPAPEFKQRWAQALQKGVVDGSALPPVQVALRRDVIGALPAPAARPAEAGLDLLFAPDPTLWDGRFANNAWLQELPKPLSTLTWDNAAQLGPATASRLGIGSGDLVELTQGGRTMLSAVLICPGHAEETILLHLGHGRKAAGRVGNGTGHDAYALRTADAPFWASGVTVRKTGQRYPLAQTQRHHTMEGRDPVRAGSLQEYTANPRFVQQVEQAKKPLASLTLLPEHQYTGHKWGMAIDLSACIGCGVCMIACQAENNIPVVGKKEVLAQREMHWIRVDHYYRDSGDLTHPEVVHQPVPCMHCENAPCELVCPTGATVHDHEGLNDMVYNRCVGTRYCSNNCPYKVRRFNFFEYSSPMAPSLRLLQNPDVTVRSRGVMEKCTYCVQRINAVRINAETADRPMRDGEVVPACAQACPTQAIVFGDLNAPDSRVQKLKQHVLDYSLLAELNTRPRTSYQARLRNLNPALRDPADVPPRER